MMKYAEIKGFTGAGEVFFGAHMYQWVEKDVETPRIVLVRAYDTPTKVWSGYLFKKTKTATYSKVELKDSLMSDAEVVEDFMEFIKGHVLEESFKDAGYKVVHSKEGK